MSNISNKFINTAQKVLPSPFSIVIILTIVTFLFAFILTENPNPEKNYPITLLEYWNGGFWDLLKFGMQMTIMLILGHVLAISKPVDKLISFFTQFVKDTSSAALITAFLTLLMSFFNWGLGLIFGAIFARKVADYCQQNNIQINYPLIGAAGYCGLMVWHGGISGSAPLIVAEEGHFLVEQIGIIGFEKTIFSAMNIVSSLLFLILVPGLVYLLGKRLTPTQIPKTPLPAASPGREELAGAERLDYSKIFGIGIGSIVTLLAIYLASQSSGLKFINPNYINFLLFGLSLIFHQNIKSFLTATEEAVGGSIGIIIQFPLYAGIMGIMKSSGLVNEISDFFVMHSTQTSLPILTFFSSGLVNIFVPSGGGQWAVQGPIIADACKQLSVPFEKGVMALAYGDQLTNMLQPFWALPLLGITKLKAQEILPFTFLIMLVGIFVSCFCLLVF